MTLMERVELEICWKVSWVGGSLACFIEIEWVELRLVFGKLGNVLDGMGWLDSLSCGKTIFLGLNN